VEKAADARFRPARIDRKDLEVPITPGLRHFPREEMWRFHEREVAWNRRFDLTSRPAVRRMARYAAGYVLVVTVLGALSYQGLALWWLQLPLGALYGAWFARAQPAPFACGLGLVAVYLLLALANGGRFGLGSVVIAWGWFLGGYLGGVTQQSKREEGIR
jgi:hypothetical protein